MKEINFDGLTGYADFIMHVDKYVLAAGVFERSKTKARALGCKFGRYKMHCGYLEYNTRSKSGYQVCYMRIPMGKGRDQFNYALAISNEIGDKYFITTQNSIEEDLYNYLMEHFKLPLLKSWMKPIIKEAEERDYVRNEWVSFVWGDGKEKQLQINGKDVKASELYVYNMAALDEEKFEKIVSDLLKNHSIFITQSCIPEMEFSDFDDYISKYGSSLVANLEKDLDPLCGLNGKVDTVAFKHKRLYPQQAACVNGMVALKKAGISYGIMNEGMGCGKTLQAIGVVEAYFVEEWLRKHPDKSMRDVYLDEKAVNYRVFVMAPGHLVEKWAAEIRKEIPFARATVIRDFSQLVEIRNNGIARNGKEYFILSKDFCKLGSQVSPIPSTVKTRYPAVNICKDCYEDRQLIIYSKGVGKNEVCPDCGGKHFKRYEMTYGKVRGMVCPECGELLISMPASRMADAYDMGEEQKIILTPRDFAKKTDSNSQCRLCGANLWGVNVKPIDSGGEYSKLVKKPSKWRKIRYFKNARKKSKETAFVLKGYEDDFLHSETAVFDYSFVSSEYGPRKTAPAAFIKKYLKGYIDVAILDEVHKYEGAGTAQANAAHALIKASNFTLGLTGTISNGTAGSFFWLLWMLEPERMRSMGYEYSEKECMRFCEKYGSVETVYEYAGWSSVYNANSRGKQLQQPRMKPGISPMLYVDFLLDRCVMLDITDLSKYLPSLKETVVTCELPDDVAASYDSVMGQLKEATHSKEGMGALSSMFTFGLSYPDKPYERKNIMSILSSDEILAVVDNYDAYQSSNILMPKEKELVRLVNQEINQGRNVFIYACYTGEAEGNITYRLQEIVEDYCNLKGRVAILQASSPKPLEREAWIMQKAKSGVKVFITNPKCVETGCALASAA